MRRIVQFGMLSVLALNFTACSYIPFLKKEPAPVENPPLVAEQTEQDQPLVDMESAETPPLATEKEMTTNIVPQTKAVSIKSPPMIPPSTSSQGVELVWQRPAEPVTVYHLRYGVSPKNLDQSARVPVANLDKIDDLSQGPLFRYILKGVPIGKDIYVSMQAENQYGMSPESAPILIPAH